MKPQPTFSVSVKLWLYSDMYIRNITSFKFWAPFGTLTKEQDSPELESHYWAQRVRF